MFQEIKGVEYYKTEQGEYLPRYASANNITKARALNSTVGNTQVMRGAFRLKGWEDGLFRFSVNQSTAIYRDNGRGEYELQLGMPAPSNKGNGF